MYGGDSVSNRPSKHTKKYYELGKAMKRVLTDMDKPGVTNAKWSQLADEYRILEEMRKEEFLKEPGPMLPSAAMAFKEQTKAKYEKALIDIQYILDKLN